MAVSIRDVAERAGVSRGTVSKVLNNVSGFQISSELRDRINEAAKELGYTPNEIARALGRGRSKTIGLVIYGLRNPFFADMAEIVDQLALKSGYRVIIELTENIRTAHGRLGNLVGWPLDGMLVWADAWEAFAGNIIQPSKRPTVFLGYPQEGARDWVAFDLAAGMRLAMTHIMERGYSNPGFLTPFPTDAYGRAEARTQAYLDVCRELGLPGRIHILEGNFESKQAAVSMGIRIANMPLGDRPDVLLCHNDFIAIGVYHGLTRAGVRVPDDVAIVGFDGIDEGKYLDKPLTSISTPSVLLCSTALKILLSRLNDDSITPPYAVSIPAELFVGATT